MRCCKTIIHFQSIVFNASICVLMYSFEFELFKHSFFILVFYLYYIHIFGIGLYTGHFNSINIFSINFPETIHTDIFVIGKH